MKWRESKFGLLFTFFQSVYYCVGGHKSFQMLIFSMTFSKLIFYHDSLYERRRLNSLADFFSNSTRDFILLLYTFGKTNVESVFMV